MFHRRNKVFWPLFAWGEFEIFVQKIYYSCIVSICAFSGLYKHAYNAFAIGSLGEHRPIQHSHRTPGWWAGGSLPHPKDPTPALGHSGLTWPFGPQYPEGGICSPWGRAPSQIFWPRTATYGSIMSITDQLRPVAGGKGWGVVRWVHMHPPPGQNGPPCWLLSLNS